MTIYPGHGEVQILDYTNAQIVTIETGIAKIQNSTFKIIHIINLEQYKPILGEIKRTMQEDLSAEIDSYPFLVHEIQQTENLLKRLVPERTKRSIDIIGTAWKWVAGTPDHEDFEIITDHMNNVLENNNRQVIINRLMEEKLNDLINRTNTITNSIRAYDQVKKDISNLLEMKIKFIKEELINVDYAIQWSKAGIINSFILSDLEMNITKDFFEKQRMPYVNLIEAIEYGEVKIASNGLTLIYIVNLPKTQEENCKKLIVKTVKKQNSIIKIPNNEVIACNGSIFEVISKCKTYNEVSICKEENFNNITKSKCLPNLLTGAASVCTKTNAQHIPPIEEISPGILLLNSYNGSLSLDEKLVNIQGTFLIKFHNVKIRIDGRTYDNKQISLANPLPAIIQPGNISANFEEILSLKMLKELHSSNTKEIETLQTEYRTSMFGSIVIGSLILIVIIIKVFHFKVARKTNISTNETGTELKKVQVMTQCSEDTAYSKGGGVNDNYAEINEINIFKQI